MEQNRKQQHEQHMQHEQMKMPDADLIVPVQDHDPMGNLVYHPAIGKRAVLGGIIGGIILAFVFWMTASGRWPVTGLGQMSSANFGAAGFMGFVIGAAVGGLAGGFSGIRLMIRQQKKITTSD